ncbi:unnamed protein product [Cylindrotheca closterium]|uniref:Uncharacterized protein n=1 Tax=Cylindrotheca closterium TaxID=2856 RepID=A0AAD2G596_9STRA|nr:unnamed protein product [Cylindrotheca closterium]
MVHLKRSCSPSLAFLVVMSTVMLSSFAAAFQLQQHQQIQQQQPSTRRIPASVPYDRICLKAEMGGTDVEDNVGEEDDFTAVKVESTNNPAKQALFDSFQDPTSTSYYRLHTPTKERTALVTEMTNTNPTASPGSTKSFRHLAPGIWRVVYAPHIATFGMVVSQFLSALFSQSPLFNTVAADDVTNKKGTTNKNSPGVSIGFDPVYYLMRPDGTMTSHARLVVKFLNNKPAESVTWFSVAGTYSSQDEDQICRVDFDEAWIQTSSEKMNDDPLELPPYASLDEVPASLGKDIINALGRFFFVDGVSVFPVSYLDDDCIVFDFELLGTRICAKKVHQLLNDEDDENNDPVLQFLAEKEPK